MKKIISIALFILISSVCYGQEKENLNFPKEKICILGQLFKYKSFSVDHGHLVLIYGAVSDERCLETGATE